MKLLVSFFFSIKMTHDDLFNFGIQNKQKEPWEKPLYQKVLCIFKHITYGTGINFASVFKFQQPSVFAKK